MTKAFRFTAALGAVLFALVGLSACGGIPGDAVVKIGNTSITKKAFEHWMFVATESNAQPETHPVVPDPPTYTKCIAHLAATTKAAKGQKAPTTAEFKTQCVQQYKSLQTEVLGFLISSQWVLSEADHLGVKVSDKETKKQFEKIKAQQFEKPSDFEKFLKSSGQTVSDLLLRVKLNLISTKIQKKITTEKSKVSEAQVAKYYNENKSKYGVPEKRSVQIILTKDEAAAKSAKKEIESGTSFASVAKKVSIDPTSKAKGGLLPEVIKGEEEKALDTAIFSASKNVLGGPVKTPFGYYIYEVKGITAGTQQTLAQAKAAIKAQLVSTGSQKALADFVKEFKKRWEGKTECRSGFKVKDCKGFKEPKTTSTPATSVPTTTTPSTTTSSTPSKTTTTE